MDKPLLGKDGLVVRDSGSWIKQKFYYLERYLQIFSVGMQKKWRGDLYYVDLFAGPGRCTIRDTNEEIDGSPLIALKFRFSQYFFFEADLACHEALETRIKAQAREKNWKVIPGDCNKTIGGVKLPPSGLGLAFIDPTGISPLNFQTIRALTANHKIDLIINFHEGMGIRMNIHQYAQKEDSALGVFVGSARWRSKLGAMSFDQTCREIVNEFIESLRALGYLAFGSDMVPVTTPQNVLLYYLLFASKNPRGTDFWREIGRIDPRGQRKLGL